jgi:phosphatidylserine/phosphatidylglycerophosphate/cardiolipin synthase-like enzyme
MLNRAAAARTTPRARKKLPRWVSTCATAKFDLTHQKSMVIDDETGFVESLNWETRDLTETRDYAVVTTKKHEVAEMIACFEADWAQQDFAPHPDSRLIWCPNNGRDRVAAFIDSAKKTLWLQNERYQDTVIIERLVRAANRVSIHIRSARTTSRWKSWSKVSGACGS